MNSRFLSVILTAMVAASGWAQDKPADKPPEADQRKLLAGALENNKQLAESIHKLSQQLEKANKEIAELLCLSKNTILFHRHNIRSKLSLKNKKINLRSHLLSYDK